MNANESREDSTKILLHSRLKLWTAGVGGSILLLISGYTFNQLMQVPGEEGAQTFFTGEEIQGIVLFMNTTGLVFGTMMLAGLAGTLTWYWLAKRKLGRTLTSATSEQV